MAGNLKLCEFDGCLNVFVATGRPTRFCSDTCRYRSKNQYLAELKATNHLLIQLVNAQREVSFSIISSSHLLYADYLAIAAIWHRIKKFWNLGQGWFVWFVHLATERIVCRNWGVGPGWVAESTTGRGWFIFRPFYAHTSQGFCPDYDLDIVPRLPRMHQVPLRRCYARLSSLRSLSHYAW